MNAIHRPASLSRNIPNLTCSPAFKTRGCGASGILFVLLFSLAATPLLWAQGADPSVTTDRADYPPGDTAVITGSGFQAWEPVAVQVVHADGTPSTGQDHEPWTVIAAEDGTFSTTWHVCEDDCLGETLLLTAVGGASGASAQALFTDAGGAFAYAWGEGTHRQLGNGGTSNSSVPVAVSAVAGGRTAVSVGAGELNSVALANDGTIWAWGEGGNGELGNGTFTFSATPVQVNALPGGRTTIAIANGTYHILALANDGTIWAWGYNAFGQLGNGGTVNKSTPTQVNALPVGRTTVAIGAGQYHSLAVANDGTLWAWGRGDSGQLGNGATANSSVPILVNALAGGRTAVRVAGGSAHSLAVANDGTAWAWGNGSFGQLGRGSTASSLSPIQVNALPGGRTFVSVAAGQFAHSLAVANDGTAWAWGNNSNGQLGDGTVTTRTSPVQVTPLSGGRSFVGIAGGTFHSLAYANDGTVWTWGFGASGQLGNGSTADSHAPVQVNGILAGHKAVYVAGGVRHSLAAVQDNSAPVANCKNVTVSAGANCTANASIDNGSNDPDSGDTIILTQAPAGPYPLGPTTVTLTVTDNHGVSSTCSAVVNVVDTTPPSVSCPVGTSASADANCQAPIPNVLSGVSASDNCSAAGSITLSQSPAAGTPVGLGPHTITVTATDQAGNSASCTTAFTVNDTTPPSVTCPTGTSASADVNCQAAIPNVLSGVSASDNCSAAASITMSQSPAAGTPVGLGPHTITVTATDQAGNSVSCTTTFTVSDTTPPSLTCPVGASASADVNCQAAIPNVLSGVSASDNCSAAGSITLNQSPAAGTPVGLGPHTIAVTATDQAGNSASCTTTFTVSDTTSPSVTCPAGTSASADANCQAAIPNVLSGVSASDNCSAAGSITLNQSPAAGTPVGLGPHTITVTATDQAGNSASCTTTFTVSDTTPPSVTCPAGTSASADVNCQAAIPNVLSGASASDNCSAAASITLSQSPAAGTPVGLGPHTITVTATDQAGNSASCTTIFTVSDTTPPSVTCPAGASASAGANCQAAIPNVLSGVSASDNCSAAGSITLSQSPAAGTPVGLGPHTITVTATDQAGNSASCTTTFTVSDMTPPSVTCPAGTSASADANCQAAIPNVLSGVSESDNCSAMANILLSQNPPAGTLVGTGLHTITVMATDQAGNSASCTTTFTVNDTTPPSVTCPGDVASCSANVNPGTATATDNCPGVTVAGVRSDNQPLTAPYPDGVTTITWTATDASGNSASCQQSVTIGNSSLVVTITSPASGAIFVIGTTVNFSGTFTDTSGGTHTATWMFDNFAQAGAVNESMHSVSASYTFTSSGVYLVSLMVNGGCASSTATTVDGLTAMVVIYDPSGGFVTGGGWINSPAGAFPAQPTLTGKANFGFVSKYLNGATIPTGETEFQFKVANLNFHSTSYEWLVVAGAKAQYKGVGTINGAGNYGFILTAIDGQLNGGGGTDKFRMKIWDKNNNDAIVYDNKIGAADGADPTTVLGGGSIVIHK